MVNVDPVQRPNFVAITNAAFNDLYSELARQQGLSEATVIKTRPRTFFGRVAFLSKYFADLSRRQRDLLRQKICVEWNYCEKRARWGEAFHWAEFGMVIISGAHLNPITLAWLLSTGFFDELCECNKRSILGSMLRALSRFVRRNPALPSPPPPPPLPPAHKAD